MLPLLLIVAAVFRFPCDDVRGSFALLVDVGISVGFAAYLFRVNPWWGMFMGAASLSLIFPHYTQLSYIAHRAVLFGFVWIVIVYHANPEDMMDAICIVALCNVAFLVLQFLGIDPLYHTKYPVGLMANRNEASALLGISFAAFLRGRWKYFIPLVLLGLALTRSLGGFGCLVACAVVYCIAKRERVILVMLILASLSFGFIATDGNPFNGRLQIWAAGIEYLKGHWVTGIGIGHWKWAFQLPVFFIDPGGGLRASMAHNEFLQMFVEMGMVFPVIAIGYVVHLVRKSKDIVSTMAMASVLASCCYHFLFHIGTTAMMAATWVAIWQRKNDQKAFQ